LILLSPNGGENVLADSLFSISWRTYESTTIEGVLLEYSIDNGRNWNHIDAVPNTGSYHWSVPIVDSKQCLVRITDSNNPAFSDTSYKVFQILCLRPGDFEPDGDVDFDDLAALASSWEMAAGQPFYNPDCDISDPNDGIIDERDLAVFTDYWLAGNNQPFLIPGVPIQSTSLRAR
jgi:hypothetical protein